MNERELFTHEQLPVGVVMLIAKTPNGEEIAGIVQRPDQLEFVYASLLKTVKEKSA